MTEIEKQALALVNEEWAEERRDPTTIGMLENNFEFIALCRAIEREQAFRQEVSDAVEDMAQEKDVSSVIAGLRHFIIAKPKPDPLVEAMRDIEWHGTCEGDAEALRAALAKRGLEIREIDG